MQTPTTTAERLARLHAAAHEARSRADARIAASDRLMQRASEARDGAVRARSRLDQLGRRFLRQEQPEVADAAQTS